MPRKKPPTDVWPLSENTKNTRNLPFSGTGVQAAAGSGVQPAPVTGLLRHTHV